MKAGIAIVLRCGGGVFYDNASRTYLYGLSASNDAAQDGASTLKDFSVQVLGADLDTFQKAAEKAAQQGDTRELNELVSLAAKTNGISVEHARSILKGFLN